VGLMQRQFNVDSSRIYVAGYSLGAYGSLALLSERPQLCAAAILVAGGRVDQLGRPQKTPIWIFHGDQDDMTSVSYSRRLALALRAARREVRYTEYAGEDHGIMRLVVAEPQLLPWLFTKVRPYESSATLSLPRPPVFRLTAGC
jgi:predicted peptidase